MDNKFDNNLRVFNTAKKFAEEILFPLMEQYQTYQRQSDFGTSDLSNALYLSEEVRDIERFNGLKAMCEVCINLSIAIKSTVYLKNNKQEIEQLDGILKVLDKTKRLFYEKKVLFFKPELKNGYNTDTIDREYFEKIKKIIQVCYVNTEILMTRNKLLFTDLSDEFKTDEELMDMIKKDYAGA